MLQSNELTYEQAVFATNFYESLAKEHGWIDKCVRRDLSGVRAELEDILGTTVGSLFKVQYLPLSYPTQLIGMTNYSSEALLLSELLHPEGYFEKSGEYYFPTDRQGNGHRGSEVRNYTTKAETAFAEGYAFAIGEGETVTTLHIDPTVEKGWKNTKDRNSVTEDTCFYHSPFYGIELEVLKRNKAPETIEKDIVKSLDNFAILKSDASITDVRGAGFEIVTVPATMQAHKEKWADFFKNQSKFLRSWYSGKCGIHIHISKKAFSLGHMERFTSFIYSEDNFSFIQEIAGRSGNSYARGQNLANTLKGRLEHLANRGWEKYSLINTRLENTIEVRCFRGNVKKEGFFKCLEFIDALYRFTRDSKMTGSTKEEFFEWLETHDYGYGHLKDWLTNKGYLGNNTNLEWRQACA